MPSNGLSPRGKQQHVLQLLQRVHVYNDLDEGYLVALQRRTIDNPFDKATAFWQNRTFYTRNLARRMTLEK